MFTSKTLRAKLASNGSTLLEIGDDRLGEEKLRAFAYWTTDRKDAINAVHRKAYDKIGTREGILTDGVRQMSDGHRHCCSLIGAVDILGRTIAAQFDVAHAGL